MRGRVGSIDGGKQRQPKPKEKSAEECLVCQLVWSNSRLPLAGAAADAA